MVSGDGEEDAFKDEIVMIDREASLKALRAIYIRSSTNDRDELRSAKKDTEESIEFGIQLHQYLKNQSSEED